MTFYIAPMALAAPYAARFRGLPLAIATGGMQVFQGLWFIVAGALAGLLGPGAVIALSGGIGTVIAVALAARWAARTMPAAGRT